MRQNQNPYSNQRGQVLVESILLMTVLLGVFSITTNYFKEHHVIQRLIGSRWDQMSGMIECGVWQPCGKGQAGLHPNTTNRVNSWDTHKQ